jgi:hypothetical protein
VPNGETVVSCRKPPKQNPWLLPLLAGGVGLCVVGGVGKMVGDFRNWQRDVQRPRERWERDA